jgi:thiamine pyrophosphokinase
MVRSAVVLSGGDPVPQPVGAQPVGASLRVMLDDADFVVAADSGLHLAPVLGLHVDRLVGDLDSADPAAVDAAVRSGAVVERHPAAKDATDLELAIETAVREGACRIVVVGGGGGRVDHFLANLLLLASPRWADVEIDAWCGSHVLVVHGGHGPRVVCGQAGDLVSLLPTGGPARGIVTAGLEYALAHEDLAPGTTRGVSNVMARTTATVELDAGTLLIVHGLIVHGLIVHGLIVHADVIVHADEGGTT